MIRKYNELKLFDLFVFNTHPYLIYMKVLDGSILIFQDKDRSGVWELGEYIKPEMDDEILYAGHISIKKSDIPTVNIVVEK